MEMEGNYLDTAAALGVPMVYRNQSLSVLSGVLPHEELKSRLAVADAAVIMQQGAHLFKAPEQGLIVAKGQYAGSGSQAAPGASPGNWPDQANPYRKCFPH